MSSYIPMREAVKITGLHPHTLRKYADNGTIPSFRIPNGDRRFDVSAFVNQKSSVVCYSRVSQPRQRDELNRQAEALLSQFPGAESIKDVGSGLNFKRKGLQTLLGRALRGERLKVVVSYRDRLARFGFDVIEQVIHHAGGEIVVLHRIETSPVEELTRDLTAIITVFSSRIHGLRSHRNKKAITATIKGTTGKAEEVDGKLPLGI